MLEILARTPESHKGDYGKVLIVAGSEGMTGAAILCAKAALRSGAGLVRVSVKPEWIPILQVAVPEAICIRREEVLSHLDAQDAVVFGPGLGTGPEEAKLLRDILSSFEKSLVLDADGLNLLSQADHIHWLTATRAEVVLTPHLGEARRLLAMEEDEMKNLDRHEICRMIHESTRGVIVLKGHETMVYDGKKAWVNHTGNPGMATAGAGDVLAGIIGSLCGQHYEISQAARLGVYIHGKAGDLARADLGEHGIIAGDLCYYTAMAMKAMSEEQGEA